MVRSKLERLQRAACTLITGAMRTTPTKVLEMLLDLPTVGMFGRIWPRKTDPRNLGIGHNWIGLKADKVDSKFSMMKDHVTLQCNFGK